MCRPRALCPFAPTISRAPGRAKIRVRRRSIGGASTLPSPKRQMTEEKIIMKAIVVTDQAAGTAGMTLVERPEPQAAINDVGVQVHASGFVPTELAWPSTWTDRLDRDRTPSIPGHELAEWSPPSAMARGGCRWDSGCSASR